RIVVSERRLQARQVETDPPRPRTEEEMYREGHSLRVGADRRRATQFGQSSPVTSTEASASTCRGGIHVATYLKGLPSGACGFTSPTSESTAVARPDPSSISLYVCHHRPVNGYVVLSCRSNRIKPLRSPLPQAKEDLMGQRERHPPGLYVLF